MISQLSENSVFKAICSGDLTNLPKPRSSFVRIFLSSTFSDTHEERDYLIENIYPLLKKYFAEQFGFEFQVVDLRWGITDESVSKNLATSICLNEIKNCIKDSCGPCFITFLSHRYGQRLLPTEINLEQFEYLSKECSNKNLDLNFTYHINNEKFAINNMLNHCYILDENEIPNKYKLVEASLLIPGFQLKNEEHEKILNDIQTKLAYALRQAAESCFSKNLINQQEKDKFFISVTEQEIFHGILSQNNPEKRSLVFIREFEDYPKNHEKNVNKWVKRYFEIGENGELDPEANKLLQSLKTKIYSKISEEKICNFKIKWLANEEANFSLKIHYNEYFKNFGNSFFKFVINQTNEFIQDNLRISNNLSKSESDLFQELLDHSYICLKCSSKFFGREEMINKVTNYIMANDNRNPFFIYGDSGSGKTSLIAITAFKLNELVPDPQNYIIILRFFGTSRQTSRIINIFESIVFQLECLLNIQSEKSSTTRTVNDLKDRLLNHLSLIKESFPNKKVVFFLDSIDQLKAEDYDIAWIIKELPDNCKMIFSVLTSYGGIMDNIKQLGIDEKENFLLVEKLNESTSLFIINEWLKKENRSLNSNQMDIIKSLFKKATLYPLYLKLMFDIVSKWTSYYMPDDNFYVCISIDDFIKYLFRILEEKHGSIIFKRICLYLTLFNNGISENEIEDILSIDDDVLESVLQYHAPPSRRFPFYLWILIKNDINEYLTIKESDDTQVITWFHRRFFEVVNSIYKQDLSSDEYDQILKNVIDYYIETWNKKPKPFRYSEHVRKKLGLASAESSATRNTKNQTIKNISSNGKINYNKRKLNELPHFILSLNNVSTKINYLINYVYFDYTFMNSKASLLILKSFLKEIGNELWNIFNQLGKKVSTNEEDRLLMKSLKQLLVLHFIYENNCILLEKYADAFAFQLCSKLYTLCDKNESNTSSNYLSRYLYDSIHMSINKCSLIMTYSYLPIVDKSNAASLVFDYYYFQTITNCYKSNYIFASTNRIFLIDVKNAKVVGVLSAKIFYEFISLIKVYLVYIQDDISRGNIKLSDLTGGVIIRNSNKIYSFNFDQKLLFKKLYTTRINELYLISTNHLIVCADKSKMIEIIDVKTGTVVYEKAFAFKINMVDCNLTKNEAYLKVFEQIKVFVSITLANGEINLFYFDKDAEKLVLIQTIQSCGLEPFASKSDSFFHPENVLDRYVEICLTNKIDLEVSRFVYCFRNGNLFFASIKKQHENGHKQDNTFVVSLIHLKININQNKILSTLIEPRTISFDDYFNNKLVLRNKTIVLYYDLENDKLMFLNKFCKIAMLLSNSELLLLFKNTLAVLKVSNENGNKYSLVNMLNLKLSYKFSNIDNHKVISSIVKDEKLICGCIDKSLKVFDLKAAFLLQMSLKDSSNEINEFNIPLTNPTEFQKDIIIGHTQTNKLAIVNASNKEINMIKIKDIPKKGLVCWNKCWQDLYLIVYRSKNKQSKKFFYNLCVYLIEKDYSTNSKYVFKEYYKCVCEQSISSHQNNVIRAVFNDKSNEFLTTSYDEITNSCRIFINNKDEKNKWKYTFKVVDLNSLNISKTSLTPNDYVDITNKDNFLLIIKSTNIYYVNIFTTELIFKTNINNTKSIIDLNGYFDFEQVEGTNDFVGLDTKNKKLVYMAFTKEENVQSNDKETFKLKLFTSNTTQIEYRNIKIRKNFLLTYETSRLSIFDLKKIRLNGAFSQRCKIYENFFYDKDLIFDLTTDLKYLIAFERPRDLSLFRLKDAKKIAQVPILNKLKDFITIKNYLLLLLDNNDIVSLMLVDKEEDLDDFNKKASSLNFKISQNDNLSIEDRIENVLTQINPTIALQTKKEMTRSKSIALLDFNESLGKNSQNRAIKNLNEFLKNNQLVRYEDLDEMPKNWLVQDKNEKAQQVDKYEGENMDELSDNEGFEEPEYEDSHDEIEENLIERENEYLKSRKKYLERVKDVDKIPNDDDYFSYEYGNSYEKENDDENEENKNETEEIDNKNGGVDCINYDASCICALT